MKKALYYILPIAMGLFVLNACDDETESPAVESQQVMTFDIHLQANNCQGEPLANGFMLVRDARNFQYAYKMDESGTITADYPSDVHIVYPLTYKLYDALFNKTQGESPLTEAEEVQYTALGETVCDDYDGDYLQVSFGDEHFVFDEMWVHSSSNGGSQDYFMSGFNKMYSTTTPDPDSDHLEQHYAIGVRHTEGIGTYPFLSPSNDVAHAELGVNYFAVVDEGPSFEVTHSSPGINLTQAPDASLVLTKIPDANGPHFQGYFSGEAGLFVQDHDLGSHYSEPSVMAGTFRGTPQ